MDSMITGDKVRLRDKKLSDARKDYAWQTDPELAQLDAAPLITAPFSEYLLDYSMQLHYYTATNRFLAVETHDGEHIGNCTCYGFDEANGEAEVGIMIGDRAYWDKGYGTDAVMSLDNHIFLHTDLRRIYLKTLDWNERAKRCFRKCGFVPCAMLDRDGYSFVVMELHRERWEALSASEIVARRVKPGDSLEKN